ncbi:MAG: O-antigen ligase family protein [Sphingobium sp.]
MITTSDKYDSFPLRKGAPQRRRKGTLGGYTGTDNIWRRNRRTLMFLFAIFAVLYGFAFTLFSTFFLLQLAIPLVVLALFVIWLLPDSGRAPTKLLYQLMLAFIIALLCWPDYIALAFPGLPWMTMVRLTGIPMAFILLISLSASSRVRHDLMESLNGIPILWKLMLIFTAIATISVVFSNDKTLSISKLTIALLYWVSIFFASAYVFRSPGRVIRLSYLLWGIAVLVCLNGIWEARIQALPWAGHLPSFLQVEDEAVQRIMTPHARAVSGIYRVQSKFTTPLGMAEFLALSMPFILHLMMTARNTALRLVTALTIPLVLYAIVLTDSRLGVVGFLMAFMIYLLYWSARRWRERKDSIVAPATVLGYPLIFALFIMATFVVGRLRIMVWGGGAAQFSTNARQEQLDMGLPMIMSHPWGYGIGMGAGTLGYVSPGGVVTIDTYFLAVALEYGVVGFMVYYAMFVAAIYHGGKALLTTQDREILYLAPLVISAINFVIIKSIFSQQENHPLIFIVLGAITALTMRANLNSENKSPPTSALA